MKVICAWCGAGMGSKPGPENEISHSICGPCHDAVLGQKVEPMLRTSAPLDWNWKKEKG